MHEHRAPTIETINTLDIPKVMISRAAELSPKRISDFLKHRTIPTAMDAKIIRTVEDISTIWTAFAPFRVEINSPQLLVDGLRIASQIATEREMREAEKEASKMLSAL